jgi:hypothetical protein
MRNCPTTNFTGGGGRREIAFASTWHARERIAFGTVLGMLLDCEERDWQRFCEAMSSSAVQQEQLPCARSNYFLNHKSSCSTTSCRRGRCTRRNLLLGVCVHPLFHFTHQQLSQYTALLSGPRLIETEAALTDHFNCKLCCVVLLCV